MSAFRKSSDKRKSEFDNIFNRKSLGAISSGQALNIIQLACKFLKIFANLKRSD